MSSKPGPDMKEPTYEQVLQFVCRNEKPFITTADISEEFPDVHSKTLRKRLNTLVEREKLEVRTVGPKSKVWYPPVQADSSKASESRRFPASDSQ